MNMSWRVEVELHALLLSTLDREEWSYLHRSNCSFGDRNLDDHWIGCVGS
jgi:hypothetical protein